MTGASTRPRCERSTRVSISGVTELTPGIARIRSASAASPVIVAPVRGTSETCGLKSRIFSSQMSPKPVITLRTMMTAATPSITPRTETHVMAEATDRFGRRYLNARNAGNGIGQMSTSTPTSPLPTAASAPALPSSSVDLIWLVGR